jgi:hypothetical protein
MYYILVGLITNGWSEDGFLEAETCSHPQIVHTIKLFELRLTDYCITIITVVYEVLQKFDKLQVFWKKNSNELKLCSSQM